MKNNILKIGAFLLSAAAFSSCLKDKGFDNGEYGISTQTGQQKVVSIALTTSDTTNVSIIALDASTTEAVYNLVPVTIAGGVPAAEDVHVVLALAPELVDLTMDTIPLPPSYTISNFTVTIPKGQATGYLQASFKSADFIGPVYALGFRIVSVDNGYQIAGASKSQGVAQFTIKNLYDGVYNTRIKSVGWAAYGIADGITFPYNNVSLVTTGATSVIFSAGTGSAQYGFTPDGGLTSFGATEPQFTFDGNTNLLSSVVNLAPDDGRGRMFSINSAVADSRFDPATHDIYLAYLFNQNGRPTEQIYDTLTYVGPR